MKDDGGYYQLYVSVNIFNLVLISWFIHWSTTYVCVFQLYKHDDTPDATKLTLKSYYGLYIENCAESCPTDCVFKNAFWKSWNLGKKSGILDEDYYNEVANGLSMPRCVDEKKDTAVKNDLAVSKDYSRGNDETFFLCFQRF